MSVLGNVYHLFFIPRGFLAGARVARERERHANDEIHSRTQLVTLCGCLRIIFSLGLYKRECVYLVFVVICS